MSRFQITLVKKTAEDERYVTRPSNRFWRLRSIFAALLTASVLIGLTIAAVFLGSIIAALVLILMTLVFLVVIAKVAISRWAAGSKTHFS